nr:hypothetical protein [Tanacetum cinerariifolium]
IRVRILSLQSNQFAEILPKIGETNALSKPVTSNSVSKPPVSKSVNNAKVIAPSMFRISSDKFWDTARYDKTVGCYKCQLDEQWFDLTKDILRDALQKTPANNKKAFSSPPSSDALINFVNNLERIWEEFTQSIHTFIEDKKNLAQHTHGKKKAPLIVIPSIRFTKLINYYLQRKHKFHPRQDSPLHFPNEEHVLGYLKFSAKGTKREVFGIHIPDNLITADIQGGPYYQEYLEKVAKHQRYLAGEQGSDLDSPTPKPAKATKKSKPSAPKADLRPPVTKPALSQQPKPKPAPAKSKGKKRKLVTEKSDKPSPARISKLGLVTKRRKPTSSLRSVDEFVAEGIPEKEPRFDDEEADVQRILEESLKSIYDAPRGPLLPVVIREPESGKYQPLPEVQGKGKEKVTDEQVSLDLLTLQTPKKKSPTDQFIFQRCTITPTRSFGHDESSSLYAELGLTDSEVESDEDVPGMDAGVQDEGQARPNPSEQDKGQAGLNPGDAAASQPQSRFTATAYPKVKENLKLMVEEQVILEEPVSSIGTLSSLQHLAKDLSFDNLFFNDKPSKADNEKTTVETEAESMVSVIIQQDTSAIPPMTTPIDKLEHIMANLIQDNRHLEERLDSHGAIQAPLRNRFRDLPEADMKEILHQRMWETNSYKTHKDHMMLYEALEKSMNRDHTKELLKDLVEARKKKKKRRDSPKMPPGSPPHQPPPPSPPAGPSRTLGSPGASRSSQVSPPSPPPPSTNQEGQSHGSAIPSSSKTAASAEYKAWTMTDIRLRPSISSTLTDLQMDDDMAPDAQVHSSNDEDIRNAHIPKVNLRQDWWKPLEEDRLATSEPAWSIPSSDVPVPKNTGHLLLRPPIYLLQRTRYSRRLYQMEECHKLLTDSVDDPIIKDNVSKPLPLGGPPGQVTIQSDFFFNKDLEYLRYSSKGSRPPLLILKIKAAYYPDVGLEEMVPDPMWIEEECKYDIAAMYDISHWWFQRQRFYINRHTSEGDRRAVRTHMRILKRDFKYLYPSDFEDLYLLNLQEDFQLGIESYQTQLNIKNPRWATTVFEYKHDYTVIDSPRADTFWDRYGVQMIMRFNEIHKFSDGTLHQIDEALDYRVKEFKFNRMNSGLNIRFWTRKDLNKSKEFMFAIQKRLKTGRIFHNLESFVGGRVRDGDYRLLKRIE